VYSILSNRIHRRSDRTSTVGKKRHLFFNLLKKLDLENLIAHLFDMSNVTPHRDFLQQMLRAF